MYYINMGKFNLQDSIKEGWQAIQSIPQTQKDIRDLAQTSQRLQSPDMRGAIDDIRREVQTFGNLQILLQGLSTIAILGIFIINLRNHNGRGM